MIPKALKQVELWRANWTQSGHLLVALDFDGTIAPIVPRPQDAFMLDAARGAIESLLKRSDTDVAIVSGRALADLRERSGISGVYYSGNHGLEIDGPGVHETRPDALRLAPRMRELSRQLERALLHFPGAFLEDKQLTLSVHSRMVDDETERQRIHDIVEAAVVAAGNGLKLTYGKRVVEVRPDVEWHKGDALLFLIDRIAQARASAPFTLYVGDDRTDEDAFAALRGQGVGVLVTAELPAETAAGAWAASPEEVVAVLEALARS
jgi:trehalose 6-phosphate phosphatase